DQAKHEEQCQPLHAQKRIAKPIPLLAFANQNFPRSHGDRQQAKTKRIERSILSASFGALRFEIGRIEHERVAHDQREKSDGYVDIKDPAPTIIIRNVAAKSRPDDRRKQRGDAESRLSCALFLFRKGIQEHALTRRLQSTAGQTLKNTRED